MKKFSVILSVIIIVTIGIFFYIKITHSPENDLLEEIILDRQEIMRDVAEKISKISPVESALGGSWYVVRFWFIEASNENFYIEYEDGHIMRQVLLNIEKKNGDFRYKEIGYFEPGETNWALKKGEDKFIGNSLDLYERDIEFGYWVRKN